MSIKLSVVIPCYNEEKNIPLLVAKLEGAIHRSDIEVILVNNGSKDGSQAALERLVTDHPFVRSVLVEVNQGYGFGILAGLKKARGEFLAWTHADMQTDPSDLVKALELAESRPSPRKTFVKGARKGRPIFDELFTFGMGVFETIYFGKFLWDINAQPNLFHRELLGTWNDPPHDFSLDLFALHSAKSAGWDVVRFPVLFPPRIHGTSSWNTGISSKWKFIKRTVDFSRKLRARQRLA